MTPRLCILVGFIFFSVGAPLAFAEDAASPPPVKAPAHVAKKAKPKPTASTDGMSMRDIQFSNPSAPPVGAAKPSKPALTPAAKGVAAEPQGGAALDLKWHAENHVNNPYWEPWVPNGQGDSVEAGVKVGF
jgi:hypothetical protein